MRGPGTGGRRELGGAAAGWASRLGGACGLGSAKAAIGGELGVGDVGRPTLGRVMAKPLALVWKFFKKPKVTRGSLLRGGEPRVAFQADLRSRSLGEGARLCAGPSGSSPWAAAQVRSWRGMKSSVAGIIESGC